ncbi:MAG: hypothetical protein AVDCRST_MAG30-3457, partial [uncultured Solirubrobacteraceae bacterium]
MSGHDDLRIDVAGYVLGTLD